MRKTFLKAQVQAGAEQVVNDFLFSEVWNPSADVYETEDEVIVIVEIAGMKAQALQFSINKENVLHIWGERKNPLNKTKGKHHIFTNIRFGTFSKYISLPPVKVNKKQTEIQNINGILKLILKKIK